MTEPREENDVRAVYYSVAGARRALFALERQGVDASDIHLVGPGADLARRPLSQKEQLELDLALEGYLQRRVLMGWGIGGALGLIMGAIPFWLIGEGTAVASGGAVAFAAAGAGLGFFLGGASGLPVNEGFFDTFASQGDAETTVVVHARGDVDRIANTLWRSRPAHLEIV